jgi:4-hydroxy-tetrahydrodipicolinate synthase
MLDAFAKSGFDVFAGSEVFLLDNMRGGGKGCITATGNINPGAIDKVFQNWKSANADALQAGITATRNVMQKYPMMAALKGVIAHYGRDPQWAALRPPLVELTAAQGKSLIAELDARGFDMPGLALTGVTATA